MFKGSLVALVTPMKPDLTIDWDAYANLIEWHLQQGSHGIVVAGTTGECATLDVKEHVEVIRRAVDIVQGQVPVIAGTGSNSLSEALELTTEAKNAKADACLLVCPYYNKPSQEGLFLFHQHVSRQVEIPQLLYNVPSRTAVDMKADTVIRLAKESNIIGIKEATGDMQRLKDIQNGVADNFLLFSGDDGSLGEFMELGGHGAISVTANVVPHLMAQMCTAANEGNFELANTIQSKLMPLHNALFLEANPIPVKWALQQMNKMDEGIRLPLTPLAAEFQKQLRDAMVSVGVIEAETI